jgi:hypothetical protein
MMRPKSWAVLSDALDEGCGHGARKAIEAAQEKHPDDTDDSLHERVAEAIRQEVLNAICERFDFDDPESE